MACMKKLKEDIVLIKSLFPLGHTCISITDATLDLVKINFHFPGDAVFEVECNILENYPRTPSIWCTNHENQTVNPILNYLNHSTENLTVLPQINYLITQYCVLKNFEVPFELSQLISPPACFEENDEGQGSELSAEEEAISDLDMEEDVDDDQDEDDFGVFDGMDCDDMDEPSYSLKNDMNDIDEKDKETLVKLKVKAREDRIKNIPMIGSTTATDRIMKELKDVYKCDSYKNGIFSVELEDDNIYKWKIILKSVDNESPLYDDLKKLKETRGEEGIILKATFKDDYPMTPPFIYVHTPQINGGFVLKGGAICMELLTTQGWSSAYNMESVILQIGATFVKGKARINFVNSAPYNYAKAKDYHEHLSRFHKSSGWYTPPKADG
uniref:Ubiquitin conjugating enzyme UBC-25 (projected from Caenorhabditis elegans ortholog ubc-25) n=1 Tax=Strongyloides venezuelensis TaxID=75913 RepID=A0A0K0FLM9_STRVS